MGLEFLGGIANAYKGYQQGADAELARQQLELDKKQREEDRTYQRSQREYNASQQARTVRDQTREDGVQDSLRAIATEREIEVNPDRATTLPMVDDSGEPSAAQLPAIKKVARYGDEIARDYARVLTKDGKFGESEKYTTYANKMAFDRSAKQFSQAVASTAGKSSLEIVNAVAEVFENDPYAGQIENIQAGPNGSITLDAVNKETGQRQTKTFANAEQVVNDLRAYYSPEMHARLEEARRASAQKIHEQNSKPVVVGAGGMLVNPSGTVKIQNNSGYIQDGFNEDGTPRLVKTAGGSARDHFDARQWDAASKIPSSIVSLPSPMGDKEIEDGNLRAAYMQVYNGAKAAGTMAPNEAAEHATTTIVRLKGAAQDRVDKALAGDKASTLTINQAVRDILKEAAQRQSQASKAKAPTGQANASEQQMRVNASVDMGADPKSIARELKQASLDLEKVSDQGSKAELRAYISDLQRQLASLGDR